MVSQILVKKKKQFDVESTHLKNELTDFLGLDKLEEISVVNRYFVEGLSEDELIKAVTCVFSEPPVDDVLEVLPETDFQFAIEFLPGQFDARASSAEDCIKLMFPEAQPKVRCAKVYLLRGGLTDADVDKAKKYLINPVEAREASFGVPETLTEDVPVPEEIKVIDGFTELDESGLVGIIQTMGLSLNVGDLKLCQKHFQDEKREPTVTEIRVIDTYWSDHCRHTTFNTELKNVEIEDEVVKHAFERYLSIRDELGRSEKPVTLMDMGTLGARYLKAKNIMKNVDESEEINACTVKVKVDVNGETQDWLFFFKNETHNHPTEIEPFGGAATCVGGAIRDPLSGRSYVYQAMRVTGCADPRTSLDETIPGKLSQRKIATSAASGYSSYGNQIGISTGHVSEIYHPGYVAKHMEVGAVVGAAPAKNVVREVPQAGDVVILLGGRTGRDGIGGATGSSKSHTQSSIDTCGSEVQKGNPVVERKLQRLFRREDAAKMIKRCNDFGAGGVSVAVGELADGLLVDLDKVPKKYEGLDGTELAISESQERMAVVVSPEDAEKFIALSAEENLDATKIAEVTDEGNLTMMWRGKTIVDLPREFLDLNGAKREQDVKVLNGKDSMSKASGSCEKTLTEAFERMASDINIASKKGLVNRFDATIGASTVIMPFGGKTQSTQNQAMVAKFPVLGKTNTVSAMAWGFNPYVCEANPYAGAYLSVVESLTKLVASGFTLNNAYLSFQEYFEKLRDEPLRWGKPMAAVLGAFSAQVDLGVGAIGGKDSMSGSFEDLDVPPTLISFAVSTGKAEDVITNEFKRAGSIVVMLLPKYDDYNLPEKDSLLAVFEAVKNLKVLSAQSVGYGGPAEVLLNMCAGNEIGIKFEEDDGYSWLFEHAYGSIIVETDEVPKSDSFDVKVIGKTQDAFDFTFVNEVVNLTNLKQKWEGVLEGVYPSQAEGEVFKPITSAASPVLLHSKNTCKPKVVIPVFPGTNCEFDTALAFEEAGAEAEIIVVKNRTSEDIKQSVKLLSALIAKSQILMFPGGFSGGDEPDGSAKLIASFMRSPEISNEIAELLQKRDGLILGICNGFQALMKLGLLPFGEIRHLYETDATLTFNTIARHQSCLVNTRICSTLSPWMSNMNVGDIQKIPISHGEGRFVCSDEMLKKLTDVGQVCAQYVNDDGMCDTSLDVNPNGSVANIEAICSPDGRILGKMGHSERRGDFLYKNVEGNKFQKLFEGGVNYFAQ